MDRYSSDKRLVNNSIAPKFVEHYYERSFQVEADVDSVWRWLNTTRTFTDSQIPPYKVEFLAEDGGESNFRMGVLCNHHGPFINFPGIIGELKAPEYRDLQYCYGSYAISFRIIRPTRLEFWLEEKDGGTLLTMGLSSYVRKGLHQAWTLAQKLFWTTFDWSIKRQFPRD